MSTLPPLTNISNYQALRSHRPISYPLQCSLTKNIPGRIVARGTSSACGPTKASFKGSHLATTQTDPASATARPIPSLVVEGQIIYSVPSVRAAPNNRETMPAYNAPWTAPDPASWASALGNGSLPGQATTGPRTGSRHRPSLCIDSRRRRQIAKESCRPRA